MSPPIQVELRVRRLLASVDVDALNSEDPDSTAAYTLPLQWADAAYAHALSLMPANPLLHVFVAHYIRTYRFNNHIEMSHYASAEVGMRECPCVSLWMCEPVCPVCVPCVPVCAPVCQCMCVCVCVCARTTTLPSTRSTLCLSVGYNCGRRLILHPPPSPSGPVFGSKT